MSRKKTPEGLQESRLYFLEKNRNLYIGNKYENLTILEIVGYDKQSKIIVLVKCGLCGNERNVQLDPLKRCKINSCGCNRGKLVSKATSKHNLSTHDLYKKWCGIKSRCYNKNNEKYPDYGAKNIVMCELWKNNFKIFFDWSIKNGWEKGLEIDRFPNKKGNYCPENCRYTTSKKNQNNRTNNRIIIIEGVEMTTKEASEKFGISYQTFLRRLNNGLNVNEVISKYNHKYKKPFLLQ